MKKHPLYHLLHPASIATVGANNNPMQMGTIQALSVLKDGFTGNFYPVHRTEKEVLGYPAYGSVFELPETPDLAMLIVPPHQVISLIEAFGKIGTRHVIIISGGFKETGAEGMRLEEELVQTARRYGVRFLGPNCIGVVNTHLPLNVTVAPMPQYAGKLGMASQSGTYVTQTLAYMRDRGIYFSKAVSVGNEADLDITDTLEYLGEDEDTTAIALYIEGIRDGERFLETARRITPHKPVIAQYVGGSEAGARAGQSHTGAMAGPEELMDGLFKQAGILRVSSIEELYEYGWTLATQPPLEGKRVAVITNSGGPGTAIAHTCSKEGLEVPVFSERLQKEIKPYLPAPGSGKNPVDLTFDMDSKTITELIPEAIMKSGEVDGVIIHGAMGTGFQKEKYPHLKHFIGEVTMEEFLSSYFQRDFSYGATLPRKYGLPMTQSNFFALFDSSASAYRAREIPVLDTPEKAAMAMLYLWKYRQVQLRQNDAPLPLPIKTAEAEKIINMAIEEDHNNLGEYHSKQVLSLYGIPVTSDVLVDDEQQALQAAQKLGYPVVLKGGSLEEAHKTEKGLVHLYLQDEEQVSRAFRNIQETAGRGTPVLISPMIRGDREFMAGMTRYPGFGPALMFGVGGIYTEALRDTTMRLAPLSKVEAREMINDIKSHRMLEEYRGMPAVNVDELASLLLRLGQLSLLHPEIKEIDLNPVIISKSEPVVVDALLVLKNNQ